MRRSVLPLLAALACAACSSSSPSTPEGATSAGNRPETTLFDGGSGGGESDGEAPRWVARDGGFAIPDAGVVRDDRFATRVVSFTPGGCAGFGVDRMPDVVFGPPVGGGELRGSLDVVSLGNGGEIVVSVEPNAIIDGPGADFIVFENPFFIAGNPDSVFAEPGEVSVSDDGVTWKTYPCTASAPPYGACAGFHPVYANPTSGISPVDPARAGGDAFDLADVGLARARFVRIRDRTTQACPTGVDAPTMNGFDLDAIAIVNAEKN